MAKQFGQTAADYEETRGADDEVWIRNFKEASTRIRIIPMTGVNRHGKEVVGTNAWPTEREHYEEGIGSFPCDETKTCPGCTDPSEKVQKRSRKYYFNALDEKGNVRVYKIGAKLYRVLQGREQRLGTLSDRDYIINKMGSGLETTYDPEPGEKYDVPFGEVKVHDIGAILSQRYASAVAAYNGEDPVSANGSSPQDTVRSDVQDTPAASTRIGVAKSDVQDTPAPAEQEKFAQTLSESGSKASETPAAPAHDGWGKNPTDEQIESADTGVIKSWLDQMEVEYPSRAPRARIIEMARAKAQEPPY